MGDHKLKRRMQTKILQENANILETPFFFITPTSLYFSQKSRQLLRKVI